MEQQSGNNFDGLFQKAAEDYPLKTNNGNWNIVAAKLNTTRSVFVFKSNKKIYAALFLLLLIGSGFFGYRFYNSLSTDNNHLKNSINISSNTNRLSLLKKQSAGNASADISSKKDVQNNPVNLSANSLLVPKQSYQKQIVPLAINQTGNTSTNLSNNLFNITASLPLQQPTTSLNIENKKAYIDNNNTIIHDVVDDKKLMEQPGKLAKQSNNNNTIKDISSTESQHLKLAPQPETFYGELYFAPDFSTVKFQRINKPGYKAGVALGYRISKRLSAELGLERLHTAFFSNAKYLNTANIKFVKPNTKVQSVNGQSKLTEVPFNIRYNLSKNNEHFFITAGTTIARIIHTEKYNYHVTRDGAPREVSRHFGALTATKFLSDLNVSAGYQTPVFNAYNLKVEPYYQVPLKGLGIGSLPVNNFGINIGLVKNLK